MKKEQIARAILEAADAGVREWGATAYELARQVIAEAPINKRFAVAYQHFQAITELGKAINPPDGGFMTLELTWFHRCYFRVVCHISLFGAICSQEEEVLRLGAIRDAALAKIKEGSLPYEVSEVYGKLPQFYVKWIEPPESEGK